MNSEAASFRLPDHGVVHTLHILKSGEIISSLAEFEPVEDRFLWVDRRSIIQQILRLTNLTDNLRKSVIVIYEEGHVIREFVNIEKEFFPFLLKSAV
jgi:hypothetical protein